MAKAKRKPAKQRSRLPLGKRLRRWVVRSVLAAVALALLIIALGAVLRPVTTPYIWSETRRLGYSERQWVPMADIAPVMARAAVAAEDARFCQHWGLDVEAIRSALADGSGRGGSTISQQVVKNLYLWHGRSWVRKALEALVTPVMELFWSKRRILEVYLNIVEFDEGVFGVEAAAQHYYGTSAGALSAREAAGLAAILPDPKGRDAALPSRAEARRARAIVDGAATIAADGRDACFTKGDAP